MAKEKSGLMPGVYTIKNKNGDTVYRSSLTVKGRHISLGSFGTENDAHLAYLEGRRILSDTKLTPDNWKDESLLDFRKAVSLMNLRDTGLYFGAPILLGKRDFLYFLGRDDCYRFDTDDLFYYSSHRIMRRGKRLFVADYGSQLSVLSRFGVKSFAVPGRDYRFINGDERDLRYENIEVINRYRGVRREGMAGFEIYKAVIHVRGDLIIGRYSTEAEAAIAYNKAADILKRHGIKKKFELNYLEDVSPREYAEIYDRAEISKSVMNCRQI